MRAPGADASDEALARSIAEGGHANAEAELCRRFAPRIRSYGLRHLRDRSAADDLVQRVLLLTLQKLRAGEVRDPARIASFILGSARLTAQAVRRGDARTAPLMADAPSLAADWVAPAFDVVDRDHVTRCLQELPERERSVIVLSFFQDEEATAIGAALGLTAGNVRVIRHRALGRLRACLEPTLSERSHEPV